jgi:hypothetical protein
MMRSKSLFAAAALAIAAAQPIESQTLPTAPALTYADLVDLALAAPIVAHVRVERADVLSEREAGAVPAGHRRFLVEAAVVALIRGEGAMPGRISYLVDLPNDTRGRAARIRRQTEFLVLGARVPGRPAELRLAAPDAQLAFGPDSAERLRRILRESTGPQAPPRITGIGRGFHVAGSLPGEGETQIFLQTADGRPISLNVLRRPGELPYWSVSLGEMVDDAARPPQPQSLLWYRLACGLPRILPRQSLDEASPDEARVIATDYRMILERLGPCVRNRVRR